MRTHRRPIVFLLAALLMLFAPLALSPLASRAQTVTPPALEDAVRVATASKHPDSANTPVFVSVISQVKGWAFGTSSIIPEGDGETEPQILLFLAENSTVGWNVAIEGTPAFDAMVESSPKELLTADQRATIGRTGGQLQGNDSMQLSFPWATGETWSFTSGPHGTALAAIDFAVSGRGNVRAAREGVAYTPCGSGSDYVRVDHGGGLSTNYYHLYGISVQNGQSVGRGTFLGQTGNTYACLKGGATGNWTFAKSN